MIWLTLTTVWWKSIISRETTVTAQTTYTRFTIALSCVVVTGSVVGSHGVTVASCATRPRCQTPITSLNYNTMIQKTHSLQRSTYEQLIYYYFNSCFFIKRVEYLKKKLFFILSKIKSNCIVIYYQIVAKNLSRDLTCSLIPIMNIRSTYHIQLHDYTSS